MEDEVSSQIILDLNERAKAATAAGEKVLNATIGMLYDEEGVLALGEEIRNVFSHHAKDSDFTYGSIAGEPPYRKGLLNWFFDGLFDGDFGKRIHSVATPGGTGALALADEICAKEGAGVLIPKICWPNYASQAQSFHMPYGYYANFDAAGKLDLKAIKDGAESLLRETGKVILIVNDPCQNPTGYSMDEGEYVELLSLVNSYHGKLIPLFDIAYIDFSGVDTRGFIHRFCQGLLPECPSYIACSFSKTFSFYGLRIGALSCYSNDEGLAAEYGEKMVAGARSIWSLSNHMAINVVSELLNTPELYSELRRLNRSNRLMVEKRGNLFLQQAKEVGLVIYPYSFGFFVSIPCDDALALTERLIKRGIFVSPMSKKIIRVALCAIKLSEVDGLAKAIKECM
ncbi:MAG: aminotransferase class I/II-fold pyridoxal phosphate-dependent enzyme [Bacillota bacterium]|nr:aminotransferase class I/II-fold pyridoxal phosphate-dependent enzyme [Bacillota bacterium]